ncbi:MAG: PQQ-binding-like beta-propeller repeat protein [Phycisphaerales bacterium]|nr:PQQ-binding-like beta-propeller repeat protein [Phycisphaerales bacterium]
MARLAAFPIEDPSVPQADFVTLRCARGRRRLGDRLRGGRVLGICALVAVCFACLPATVWAQRNTDWRTQLAPQPGLLPRNPALENLLRTAEDALARRDWKLAIDSLQRIIDDAHGALLPTNDENETYIVRESARRRATALLAAMPPEGLSAYRLLNDGRAATLWQWAREDGDEDALRTLVERYLLSSTGDNGADFLAALLIDRGLAADALNVLDRIDAWCADSDVPVARRASKRAVCWLMLGDRARAEATLEPARSVNPNDASLAAVADLIATGWSAYRPGSPRAPEESWPLAGGSDWRSGVMPATSPELSENSPWRYPLLSDEPDWWDREYLPNRDRDRGLPAASAVIGDGRVFVKNLDQIQALDVESLEPLWHTRPPTETGSTPRYRNMRGFGMPGNERVFDSFSTRDRMLYDYVGTALAVADGMVFEIEREGAGEYAHADSDRTEFSSPQVKKERIGSRLVARDAESGAIRWERGRTGATNDPLGEVDFLSVPISLPTREARDSGDELWVTFARRNDIYICVLDPQSGALRREMLLCSVDMRELDGMLHEAVYPATDGRTLYFAMSAGLVLAVDVDEFALLWGTTYPRSPQSDRGFEPANWFCGPPVISGRTLLAASPDSSRLLALDRSSGGVLWTYPRPAGAYYLLAADDRNVWIGGDAFTCLDIVDGREVWRAFDGAAVNVTGRAALSGNHLLIPTLEGLDVVDATTGEAQPGRSLPQDQLPLGNLLCVASAMFSVDTNEVRKFPDLTLSYPRQLARFEADPTNAGAARRLSWMELLRGNPKRTLEVQDQSQWTPGGDGRYDRDMARIRIDALLQIAALPESTDVHAADLLHEAIALADSDFDRLRATLQYALRLHRTGRSVDAYLTLWALGCTTAGDGYVTIEPRLRNKSRLVIASVLSRLERDLTSRQLAEIAAKTQAALADAVAALDDVNTANEGRRKLLQLAELDDAGGAGQAALLALGQAEYSAGQFERSEQHFREAIRRDRVSATTAEAMRELIVQYLDPRQDLPAAASRLIDELSRQNVRTLATSDGESVELNVEVARLRELAGSPATFDDFSRRFAMKPLTSNDPLPHIPATSLVEYASNTPEAAANEALLFDAPNQLRALHLGDWEISWTTALHLLGSFNGLDQDAAQSDQPPHTVAQWDGQTAVISGADGLFGVGMLTGRRLWGIGYEDDLLASQMALRNRLVAIDRGRMICAPRRGVLTCASVVDGGDVRWERILRSEQVDTVFLKDAYCITLDNLRQRATAYDANNGRHISSIEFKQPKDDLMPIPVVYDRDHLVGPADDHTIVCFGLRDGTENWRYAMPSELRWAFNAGDGYIGACSAEGHIRLIDILSGEVALETQLDEASAGYVEGVVHGDTLLVMPAVMTERGGFDPMLISLDMATGAVRWKRSGFGVTGASQFALWKLLHVADDVVPMFRRQDPVELEVSPPPRALIAVEIVDKNAGETVEPVVPTGHRADSRDWLTGEFGVWPGWLLMGTKHGILALETVSMNEPPTQVDTEVRQ